MDYLNSLRSDRIFPFALQRGRIFQKIEDGSRIRRFRRIAGSATQHRQSADINQVVIRYVFQRTLGRETYWKRRVPSHNNSYVGHRAGTAAARRATSARTTSARRTAASRRAAAGTARSTAGRATVGVTEIDRHFFRPGRFRENLMDVFLGPTFRRFVVPGVARGERGSLQPENRTRANGEQKTSRDHKSVSILERILCMPESNPKGAEIGVRKCDLIWAL